MPYYTPWLCFLYPVHSYTVRSILFAMPAHLHLRCKTQPPHGWKTDALARRLTDILFGSNAVVTPHATDPGAWIIGASANNFWLHSQGEGCWSLQARYRFPLGFQEFIADALHLEVTVT